MDEETETPLDELEAAGDADDEQTEQALGDGGSGSGGSIKSG